MNENDQRVVMLAAIQSMILELDVKLGSNNPWREIEFGEWTTSDLVAIKRLLHELLYAPPSRIA